MAHIRITMPEITVEQRQQLVKNLTETISNILQFPEEVRRRVSVRLDFYQKNEMGRGGQLLTTPTGISHLEVFTPTVSYEQKRELATHLTKAFCDTLGQKPDAWQNVFLTIQEFHPDSAAVGGRLMAELVTA